MRGLLVEQRGVHFRVDRGGQSLRRLGEGREGREGREGGEGGERGRGGRGGRVERGELGRIHMGRFCRW